MSSPVQSPALRPFIHTRVFTKVLAEALEPLRLKGVAIVPYLDDLLLFSEAKEKVAANQQITQKHLNILG